MNIMSTKRQATQLSLDLPEEDPCRHQELEYTASGGVRCKQCGRVWSKKRWAHIEAAGSELD